jgi:hypothetical protein
MFICVAWKTDISIESCKLNTLHQHVLVLEWLDENIKVLLIQIFIIKIREHKYGTGGFFMISITYIYRFSNDQCNPPPLPKLRVYEINGMRVLVLYDAMSCKLPFMFVCRMLVKPNNITPRIHSPRNNNHDGTTNRPYNQKINEPGSQVLYHCFTCSLRPL